MAFDGITISCLKEELRRTLLNGRIYKIAQPETDELLLTVKTNNGQYRLVLSASASLPLDPLPPDPPIQIDAEMFQLLSDADRKLGRLDGITEILPNPQLFVNMYVLKEDVLSSQIEGTQASFSDVLGKVEDENDLDIGEVSNYADAMYYGLERLGSFPMSLRLIREIHFSRRSLMQII